MALRFDVAPHRDPRAASILAKSILRELRSSGYSDEDILCLASELLGAVTAEMKVKRTGKG
jgi:nickel-dependent lactate racemase